MAAPWGLVFQMPHLKGHVCLSDAAGSAENRVGGPHVGLTGGEAPGPVPTTPLQQPRWAGPNQSSLGGSWAKWSQPARHVPPPLTHVPVCPPPSHAGALGVPRQLAVCQPSSCPSPSQGQRWGEGERPSNCLGHTRPAQSHSEQTPGPGQDRRALGKDLEFSDCRSGGGLADQRGRAGTAVASSVWAAHGQGRL